MKAPLFWLKDYVDIDISANELKDKLFSCGFEVEDMYELGGKVDKIVVCKVLSMEKHPNADKLTVTQVDAGKYGKLQIITAATNLFLGALVPVALDGSTLYNGEHIYNGALRGLPSYGMFCSGEELGITDDYYEGASVNGILILKEDYPLGAEVKEVLGLNDVVFDINVTANRPDCQSILGLAREVAAVLNKPIKYPNLTYKVNNKVSTKKVVKVTDYEKDLCPRYISHYVENVKFDKSPSFIKKRLFAMGIRSISNIVDITNFVLLEIGQPMHAFDLNLLNGNEINVRRAKENEKIQTLDEKTFTLNTNNLVICDAEKPVAIAGIMGGLNSGINENTNKVLFESAKFARDNIRKSSKELGQRTDSSSRYEKGIDAYTTKIGMERALNLIDTLGCGDIACDEYDICEDKLENKIINTTIEKINGVLGIDVPVDTICNILKSLEFEVQIKGNDLTIKVPLYREDVEGYPDIAEEIIREYGYSHITPTLLKNANITNGGRNDAQKNIDNLKNTMVGFGFNEIITYSFVSEKEYELFSIDKNENGNKLIKIINPLGEDMSVMRTSLLPSVIRAVSFNVTRKNYEGRLFELAKVYKSKEEVLTTFPKEENVMSFAMFGDNEDFFTAKGVIEELLSAFCNGKNVKYLPCDYKRMHPTRSAFVYVENVLVGYFGQLNPIIAEKLDIDKEVYCGEIFYDELSKLFTEKITFKPISKFPIVERDLAIMLDENVPCQSVIDCIKNNGGEFLNEVKLFDVYCGSQIESGKKSMAFNLTFINYERTLTVEEIDSAINTILKGLREDLNAQLR